ncbi:MAG: sugar ABC transporter substrate-binding protein [Marinomonas sp.]|jgi:glucose/mannose transport system substrate-binding protein|uniref:Probable sugar-binding periplasmic protein n=1 Tax=Marinomonas communis TaxID=28254 RepID=A0A4R6XEY0_9GAMM|nr:ABC transporter substrate-binding protein [Marinomonas communis]MCC4274386.1 ABC transporter substrate-binding protein [Marinomonas communis]RUM49329.1 MAG: sugar ABC transporter substrate-binding protein [Marinomonas sp.]TDR14248.1 carbohydrate ABC transporter substrate-binding protein (CUT1 family) [Marinomonas communis]
MKKIALGLSSLAISVAAATAHAGEVEVLHWWTSGGEAKSINVLKELMTEQGHTWKDFAVAGGGGESAMTVLKSRAIAGNPPAAAQIKGPTIQEWGDLGFLTNLDAVAEKGQWDVVLPQVVSDVMKYDGHYVAAPVNVHRVNWLWANPEIFKKAGASIPSTWEQFFEAADKIKAAGFTPLAHGGQAWQDATLFEAIALAKGSQFYSAAFVGLDDATLRGADMIDVFKTFKKTREYVDPGFSGRDWNIATSMVINGDAAMQIMGDWAKGEFTAAGKKAGIDYVCYAAPGTSGQFTFNIDSLAMFQVDDESAQGAQQDLAKLMLEPTFQETFNLNKGSIPARLNMPRDKFDTCAHASMDAFLASSTTGDLVPSMAHGMAVSSMVQGAIYDVVTNFYNSDSMTAEEAVDRLARAVKASM